MITNFKTDDRGRLCELNRLEILDTLEEDPFEEIISLVQQLLNVPMCAVSLVDKDRQWFKARRGLDVPETDRNISFCTHAIMQESAFVVEDATTDEQFHDNPLVTGAPNIRSYCGIPLRMPDGYNIGSLCIIDRNPRKFKEEEIDTLTSFARLVVEKIELRQIASTDALTGALARRAWIERANEEIDRSRRYGTELALLLLDIDHFKDINDRHGHRAGDIVLKKLADMVLSMKRSSDIFGRFGGEEFVILMPETNAEEASIFAHRLLTDINAEEFKVPSLVNISASAGAADLSTGAQSTDELLHHADCALYQAKQSGRNRVVISDSVSNLKVVDANGDTHVHASVGQ